MKNENSGDAQRAEDFYCKSDWHKSMGVAAKDMPPALIVASVETAFAFAEAYAAQAISAERERLRAQLGEALGNVKTMQYTLEDVYETCRDYADAPTLSKATALGIVRKVQQMVWRELHGNKPEVYPNNLPTGEGRKEQQSK